MRSVRCLHATANRYHKAHANETQLAADRSGRPNDSAVMLALKPLAFHGIFGGGGATESPEMANDAAIAATEQVRGLTNPQAAALLSIAVKNGHVGTARRFVAAFNGAGMDLEKVLAS